MVFPNIVFPKHDPFLNYPFNDKKNFWKKIRKLGNEYCTFVFYEKDTKDY
jgi:hypothetical protein